MTRILFALILAGLMTVLACSSPTFYAQAQTRPQGQRLPQAAPQAVDEPDEDESDPDQDEDEDEDEDEPKAQPQRRPVPPPRQVITPQRVPVTPQRVQPAKNPPAQVLPQTPARARVQLPSPAQKQVQGTDDLPPLDKLTQTRERPLFSSTRRAPEVETDDEPDDPITEGGSLPFELVGIVRSEDVSVAIFRNTETKEESRVAKGEKFGKWNVEEIAERAVVLRGGDKRVRMRMFNEANVPGIQVGRVAGEHDSSVEESEATEDDDAVDEDINPSSSPQVRPATAQPKPPPSLRDKRRRPAQARPKRPGQQP